MHLAQELLINIQWGWFKKFCEDDESLEDEGHSGWPSEFEWTNWDQQNSMKRKKDMILKDEFWRSGGAQYANGEEWRNNSRKNEETEPKQKQHPVVDVTRDGSKVWCSKEHYCIGTLDVRSMNQGKLEVIKQEMASVNIDILGISELKWMRTLKFNSDDHYIYCGQESLRRNGIALIVNKSLKCSTWVKSPKWHKDLC